MRVVLQKRRPLNIRTGATGALSRLHRPLLAAASRQAGRFGLRRVAPLRSPPAARSSRLLSALEPLEAPPTLRKKLSSFRVGGKLPLRRKAPPPEPEALIEDVPLRGGAAKGPIALNPERDQSARWKLELDDPFRRCYVSYCSNVFPASQRKDWFDILKKKIDWQRPKVGERLLPRKAAWLTMEGCSCVYRYGRTSWPAIPMDPWFCKITDEVCKACGVTERPNACNANLYEDGLDSVGWHADDEPLFRATTHDALIISLSLGASRTFDLCPNDDPLDVVSLRLEDGDVCTMEGLTQKHYKHRVGIDKGVGGPRINLTWRWIKKHDMDCGMCRLSARSAESPAPPPRRDTAGAHREVPGGIKRRAAVPVDEEELAKRRKRAARFGGKPLPEEAKPALIELSDGSDHEAEKAQENAARERRKARFGAGAATGPKDETPAEKDAAAPAPAALQAAGARRPVLDEEAERKRSRLERFGLPTRRSEVVSVGKEPPLGDAACPDKPDVPAEARSTAERVSRPRVSEGVLKASAEEEEEEKKRSRAARFDMPPTMTKVATELTEAERKELRRRRFAC